MKAPSLSSVFLTKKAILRCMCGIYLIAFGSFFYQSEALFSSKGISPVNGAIIEDQPIQLRPNLIRIGNYFSMDTFTSIEIITLIGILLSFLGFISNLFCVTPTFAVLWIAYYSLVDITKNFHQQADDLLLEVGIVCILMAPTFCHKKQLVTDNVLQIMLRWILFRFLFTSGAVKLESGCPHWWNLTGLRHHFLTLPLPTIFSYYSHYLSLGFLKLAMVYVNITELVCTWLFFAPVRSLRIFSFYWHLILQLFIIVSGNYGFINFMVIILLLSLLDDKHFQASEPSEWSVRKAFGFILTISTLAFIGYFTTVFYHIGWKNSDFDVKILFNNAEYSEQLRQMVKLSPFVATISIINVFLNTCISHPNVTETKNWFDKLTQILNLLTITLVAISLIGVSTVPHGKMHTDTDISNTSIGDMYQKVNKYHVVNQYGQHLVKMRSERLELTFEYSHSADAENAKWNEVEFLYKPANLNRSLPFFGITGPYFNRLDFLFYDAVGNGAKFEKNIWLTGVAYRLLQKQTSLLTVLNRKNIPKFKKAPKFVRVIFYKFNFVPKGSDLSKGLWERKQLSEYLPPTAINSTVLKKHLPTLNISNKPEKNKANFKILQSYINIIRTFVYRFDGHIAVMGLITATLILMFGRK